MADSVIDIELVYLAVDAQSLHKLTVPVGTSIESAITSSGILQQHPEIDLTVNPVGIFSKKLPLNTILNAGDRVEIYRPLLIDPMQRRRLKAKKKK